ncbi:hypothetical protein B0H14DRAFT_2916901 [Mycena olivaceomarginata]|nr:hypothetical protein B0H14DRAFT_2916901 [Mycena olivaceomarginata]
MLVPIELTIDPKLKVKEEEADFPMSVKSEPIETELCSTRSITQRQKAKPTPSLCFTSPVTFTKEFLSTSLDHPTNTEQFQGLRDLVPKSTPSLGTHFRLSCGDDHYLARQLELEAARGELNRGHQLKALLAMLIDKYGTNVLGLSEYSTPDLFIATVREQNTVLGHLVCQPKPDIPFNKVVEPELDILNAISHYSLVQNKQCAIVHKIQRLASVNDTHRSSSSGLYDEGPEAIDQFMDEHVCNAICDGFGLAPF